MMILVGIIITFGLKVQNPTNEKQYVNVHSESFSVAAMLDITPAEILRGFRLTGIDSTVCFEMQ
jgi:hypothetical protein